MNPVYKSLVAMPQPVVAAANQLPNSRSFMYSRFVSTFFVSSWPVSRWIIPILSAVVLVFASLLAGGAHAADVSKVRAGVLKFGTVNWELNTIQHHEIDQANGIDLEVTGYANGNASRVAFQGGAVDVIVADWIWVARQRAEGRNLAFFPYSLAVGALMVRPEANISSLTDLKGKKLGIAGGPVDKSWLLMRAYSQQQHDADLADIVEPQFAAPPLINKLMAKGELDAAINFWHFGAKLKAAGMDSLISTAEVLPALGVDGPVPLLGWVFDREWAEQNPDLINGFLAASYAAKDIMIESDDEWERLRKNTKAKDDAELVELRDTWRIGAPRSFGDEEKANATKVFELLAQNGGKKLVGEATSVDPATFWDGFTIPAK
jgi:NitT/TauT family transport system substrate-binding protein